MSEGSIIKYTLEANDELRLELATPTTTIQPTTQLSPKIISHIPTIPNSEVSITLYSGTAEIFGTELPLRTAVSLPPGPTSLAVYSWHGCVLLLHSTSFATSTITSSYLATLDVSGLHDGEELPSHVIPSVGIDVAYISKEDEDVASSQVCSINLHTHLSAKRSTVKQNPTNNKNNLPPNVLILSPPSTGKLTLLKTLTSYALKQGQTPMLVNLDPNRTTVGLPGVGGGGTATIGCGVIKGSAFKFPGAGGTSFQTSDICYDQSITTTSNTYGEDSLSYFTSSPEIVVNNPAFYKTLVSKIGRNIKQRRECILQRLGETPDELTDDIIREELLVEYSSGLIAVGVSPVAVRASNQASVDSMAVDDDGEVMKEVSYPTFWI